MRRLVFAALVGMAMAFALGGNAHGASPVSEAAKVCQTDHARYGFANTGQCVSFVARGGTLGPVVPPSLSLVDGVFPCSGLRGCFAGVSATGLAPGSEVLVYETSTPTFGAPYTVGADGSLSVTGIFHIGICTSRPSITLGARGTAPGGATIISDELTVDLGALMPPC